jgi:hypothetical protein
VDQLIIGLLPAEIRARHGDEVEDMLASSTRPVRDRGDIAIAAVGLRLGRATRPLLVAAVIGVCGFALGLADALGNLQHGAMEIPDHWWSTFIATGFTVSLFAAIVLRLAQSRAIAWTGRR